MTATIPSQPRARRSTALGPGFVMLGNIGIGTPTEHVLSTHVARSRPRSLPWHSSRSRRSSASSCDVETDGDAMAGRFDSTPADVVSAELGSRATLVQFSTEMCARCPQVRRLLHDYASGHDGLAHVEVDLTHRPDLSARYRVPADADDVPGRRFRRGPRTIPRGSPPARPSQKPSPPSEARRPEHT